MGEAGDYSRTHILDAPMLSRVQKAGPLNALDVGCGEGRFCRMMSAHGIQTTGIDPTPQFLKTAMGKDTAGTYVQARGEDIPFEDASFDLVVSYLSLIDIEGFEEALAEMARVLRPGGQLLIANLNSFITALPDGVQNSGWIEDESGQRTHYGVDNYMKRREAWTEWRGIKVLNYHRPLRDYMRVPLKLGLNLIDFEEPSPWRKGGPDGFERDHSRVPFFVITNWQKPD